MDWNSWDQALNDAGETLLGDREFIEFTVDPSGYEIEEGTLKNVDESEVAPFLPTVPSWLDPVEIPDVDAQPYISAWKRIYSSALIAYVKDQNT